MQAFQGPQTMQAFLWQEGLIGVAEFVSACIVSLVWLEEV